jgi:hypothetical protein
MKNKNLQSLLRTIADQQDQQDETTGGAELENLDQDLAAKLKGGVQEGNSASDGTTVNNSCPNYGCS